MVEQEPWRFELRDEENVAVEYGRSPVSKERERVNLWSCENHGGLS
jgi:hypothetical protein